MGDSVAAHAPPFSWHRLFHRWFVQYNPVYLLSAALVLGGVILVSRGLAQEGSVYGSLGVAVIAELYALALIGATALLTRIGQRRPAVLLALITALYQADLTLHTETCVYLGVAGVVGSALWVGIFALKLHLLERALLVRLERRAWAVAMAARWSWPSAPVSCPTSPRGPPGSRWP